jgi:hypothetical protein
VSVALILHIRYDCMAFQLRSRVKAVLKVYGFTGSANEISEILGIEPSETFRAGDPVLPQSTRLHSENGWRLSSPVDPENATAEDAVRALLDLVPHRKAFATLPRECEVVVSCTIYGYEERPYCAIAREDIKRLAEIGATLDIDTYDLCKHEP